MSRHQILELCEEHMSSGDYVKASNTLKNTPEETEEGFTLFKEGFQIIVERNPSEEFDGNLWKIIILGYKKIGCNFIYKCLFLTIGGEPQEQKLNFVEMIKRLDLLLTYRKTETITLHSEVGHNKIQFNKFKNTYGYIYEKLFKKDEGGEYDEFCEQRLDVILQCHEHIVDKYIDHIKDLFRESLCILERK